MPRMTNTYMLAGEHDPAEIIPSVKNGIYAVNFGGGQVDITSGNFVFSVSEAYLIEDGKVSSPVKGAMLIGNGPTDLNGSPWSATTWRSTPASAPAARTARACRSASASRRCAWTGSRSAAPAVFRVFRTTPEMQHGRRTGRVKRGPSSSRPAAVPT